MYRGRFIAVVIPALNEEASIGNVLTAIPGYVDRVIVCDNGSTDATAEKAVAAGAEVVREDERGYGAACLRAIAELDDRTGVIVFLDADYSDYPEEMMLLLEPIVNDKCDVVIGTRMVRRESRRVLTPAARFGNWLTTALVRMIWGYRFTDLGPFRAVTWEAYQRMNMRDRNYGWTIELQIKAARLGLQVREVPVSYRARIGKSKISGTITGSVKAGAKILYFILRELVRR